MAETYSVIDRDLALPYTKQALGIVPIQRDTSVDIPILRAVSISEHPAALYGVGAN